MKLKFLLSLLTFYIFLLAACKKEKYTTEPQIKFKSISPSQVVKTDIISFICSFTDQEGDIQDSVLYVFKRFNGAVALTIDTVRLKLNPDAIPIGRLGEIELRFSYGELLSDNSAAFLSLESVDREVSFGLIIRDKATHRSNYVESGRITLKKL